MFLNRPRLARAAAVVWVAWTASIAAEAGAADARVAPTPQDDAIAMRQDENRAALRRSSDLRARILASTEMDWTDENKVEIRELIPTEDLVDQARGATDPLVLDLMVQHCRLVVKVGSGCDAMAFARRWTEADPQNQLAWLTLASVQEHRGDHAGARSTFVRAARASAWHEHGGDLARFVAGQFPPALPADARNAVLVGALGWSAALVVPYVELGRYCREDGDVRAACAIIVATIFRDTESLLGLTLAAPYAKRAHIDASIVASYLQEAEAIRWALQVAGSKGSGPHDPALSDDAELLRENARLQALVDLGERRLGDRILLEQRVGKGDAAARYAATLTAWQSEQRAKLLATQ